MSPPGRNVIGIMKLGMSFTLAMLRLELLPVRHGGKEGLTRLHRRRGLRGEDGVVSFRSRTLGGVLERRDMIDQELEVDVDAV